jgi:hypothetical protein
MPGHTKETAKRVAKEVHVLMGGGPCHVSNALDLVAGEVQVPARPIDGGVSQQRADKANEERQRGEGVLWRCPLQHCTREVTRTEGTKAMSRQQRS